MNFYIFCVCTFSCEIWLILLCKKVLKLGYKVILQLQYIYMYIYIYIKYISPYYVLLTFLLSSEKVI